MNRIPGINFLAKKTENFKVMNQYLKAYPLGDRFFPETYLMPDQHSEYVKAHSVRIN